MKKKYLWFFGAKGKIKSCLYEFPTEATKFLPYVIESTVTRDLRDKTLRDKLKHIKFDDEQNYQFFGFKLFLLKSLETASLKSTNQNVI